MEQEKKYEQKLPLDEKEEALIDFLNLDFRNNWSEQLKDHAIELLIRAAFGPYYASTSNPGRIKKGDWSGLDKALKKMQSLYNIGGGRPSQNGLEFYQQKLKIYARDAMFGEGILLDQEETINERISQCKMTFDFRTGELGPAVISFNLEDDAARKGTIPDTDYDLVIQTAPTVASLIFKHGKRLIRCGRCFKFHLPKRKRIDAKFCSDMCKNHFHNSTPEARERKRELAQQKRAEGDGRYM